MKYRMYTHTGRMLNTGYIYYVVLSFYHQIILRYDVILIMEIRDQSETAFVDLLNEVNRYVCK
jgi:hypothetical protein